MRTLGFKASIRLFFPGESEASIAHDWATIYETIVDSRLRLITDSDVLSSGRPPYLETTDPAHSWWIPGRGADGAELYMSDKALSWGLRGRPRSATSAFIHEAAHIALDIPPDGRGVSRNTALTYENQFVAAGH